MNNIETINQRICAKLIKRDVIYPVRELISWLTEVNNEGKLRAWDEVGEALTNLQYGEAWDWDEIRSTAAEASEDDEHERIYGLEDGDEELIQLAGKHGIEKKSREIRGYWIVKEFLAKKLKEKGETVEEIFGLHIWGRTDSGQAIGMDSVILEIASDMGILAGQRRSWEEKL